MILTNILQKMLKQDLTLQNYELEFNSIKSPLTKLKNEKK